jgi:hypothetical protein
MARLKRIVEPERGTWVYDRESRQLVPKDQYVRPEPKRSHLPAPGVISDTMDPVRSMQDGRIYDSKSAIRRHYKAAGVVEIGNDPARLKPFVKPKPDKKQIRDAVRKAEAKVKRGEYTEATKRKHV